MPTVDTFGVYSETIKEGWAFFSKQTLHVDCRSSRSTRSRTTRFATCPYHISHCIPPFLSNPSLPTCNCVSPVPIILSRSITINTLCGLVVILFLISHLHPQNKNRIFLLCLHLKAEVDKIDNKIMIVAFCCVALVQACLPRDAIFMLLFLGLVRCACDYNKDSR